MAPKLSPQSAVIVAVDRPDAGKEAAFRREYFLCRGDDLLGGRAAFTRVAAEDLSHEALAKPEQVHVFLYPTRTYHEGLGGGLFSAISPEDRGLIRAVSARHPGRTSCWQVPPLFQDELEKVRWTQEQKSAAPSGQTPAKPSFFEFQPEYLSRIGELFKSSMTVPNKQDYMWLATKTFGLNLAIRLAFMLQGVRSGQLPLVRAAVSTSWYQLQDAVFTVFGQTYMKFLGKMTGMVRVHKAHVGDFAFVYLQLCGFEFLNRLLLGPLGENPLVYTPQGLALIFANILQGMLSGGPLIPAINQMRKVGVISHSTMMHLYQASSLTMHFGLFASFGYQKFYAVLTGAILLFSWTSYFVFSTLYKDGPLERVEDSEFLGRLDRFARDCARA